MPSTPAPQLEDVYAAYMPRVPTGKEDEVLRRIEAEFRLPTLDQVYRDVAAELNRLAELDAERERELGSLSQAQGPQCPQASPGARQYERMNLEGDEEEYECEQYEFDEEQVRAWVGVRVYGRVEGLELKGPVTGLCAREGDSSPRPLRLHCMGRTMVARTTRMRTRRGGTSRTRTLRRTRRLGPSTQAGGRVARRRLGGRGARRGPEGLAAKKRRRLPRRGRCPRTRRTMWRSEVGGRCLVVWW
jgi:hypothetical protein